MKKLMLAAAIVCAAVMAQAATINWTSMGLNVCGQKGDSAELVDGATVYLVNGDASTFLSSVIADDFATAIAGADIIDYATQGASKLSNPHNGTMSGSKDVITGLDAGDYKLFMTMIDGEGNVYISESKDASLTSVGSKSPSYSHDAAYAGTTFALEGGYKDAGWYTVPEPTSGLLLLLGVAGLALRRRRA